MKDSNIFQLLGTLNRAEHKQLAQWLQSPLFNRQPQPLALYRYLHQCLEQKRPPLPEAAWSHMTTEPAQHPTENIPERRGRPRTQARTSRPSDQTEPIQLRLAMSTLLALTEDFLVYQYRANDRVRHAVDLMACYREKGLDQAFEKTLHAARKASQKQPHRHTGYFDAEADIAFEWYQYAGNHRKTEELHLQTLSLLTDTAYAARKLREACLAITYQTVYRNTVDQGMLNALLDYVKQSPQLLATPAVALYYYCYLLFAGEQDRAWFSQFKQLLMAQQQQLPTEEQRTLHLLGINYCILKINQMQREYCHEALELYQSGLQSGILIENGVISHMAFNNIVSIALKVDATEWAQQFIRDYQQHLENRHRLSTVCMNLARIYHIQRNYDAALAQLEQFDSRDQANNLLARSLQLKIYYETEDYDALELHLQSMQLFIRRQRVIGYHKHNYLNIIRYTKKLMLHNPNDKVARAALRASIAAEAYLTEKEWLLARLGG